VLENTTSGFVEITLFGENINEQQIFLDYKNEVLQINLK
jgi:hypothetical protein